MASALNGLAGARLNPCGVMFHHFHDRQHPVGQGSISAEQLEEIIFLLGRENILDAQEWMDLSLKGQLPSGAVCLTFDDSLRCQYDVAYPVLQRHRIRCFWFIYTSVFDGVLEKLEVYRYFRTVAFPSIECFYDSFSNEVRRSAHDAEVASALAGFDPGAYLKEFPFYSRSDREFRFVRDRILGPARYNEVMDGMLKRHGFSSDALAAKLWVDEACLRKLNSDGHIIGLHSHSHSMSLVTLAPEIQKVEYETNLRHLHKIVGVRPLTMSHPCNSYDTATLAILNDLGIRLGFRSNMAPVECRSNLEFPREDHTNLLKRIRRAT